MKTMKALSSFQKLNLQASSVQVKCFSSKANLKLIDDVEKSIIEENLKAKHHPGINKSPPVIVPDWVVKGIEKSLEDVSKTSLLNDREKFVNYLFSRRRPLEENEIKNKYHEIEADLLKNVIHKLSDSALEDKRIEAKGRVLLKLKQSVYGWKSLEYNNYRSLLYMISRSAGEYSALHSIFKEITMRDPEFKPKTLLDYGSGIGTVFWATHKHWGEVDEYTAVDTSNSMNDISETIIKHVPGKKSERVFYRQYIPLSNLKHDLVVSAYSLFELPDAKNRLQVLINLWRKTNKYLVIVEQGTNAGFQLINEAREFIMLVSNKSGNSNNYFIFAPCPHQMKCPRFVEGNFPCNFITRYTSLPNITPMKHMDELYTYIVFKKGQRTETDNWYRAVQATIRRSKHARCKLCTTNGKLEEIVFTKLKHGKALYQCAKATRWGDRLPVQSNLIKENAEGVTNTVDNSVTEKIVQEKVLVSKSPSSTLSETDF